MSQVTISGNAGGTGIFTIASPNSNTNRTLTLPDATGTIALQGGAGVGKVLQVVRATDTTQRTTTSTSFVDASISVTITPQRSDSAVLLIYSTMGQVASSGQYLGLQITDNSNNAISGAQQSEFGSTGAGNDLTVGNVLIGYATPATTSATTYKGRFRAFQGGTVRLRNDITTGQLFAIEVAA